MPIYQNGTLNTTAQIVPDVDVIIVPPAIVQLNGVPTNVVGLVGTASWGPVNSATLVSDYASYSQIFGPLVNRTYDMGTYVAVGTIQGASNFRCVRVTDGTDTAAQVSNSTCITFKSIYTGSYGANTTVAIGVGTKTSTYKCTVTLAGFLPEVFDNISGAGATFWTNLAQAINGGTSAIRGPSQIITALSLGGTTAPTVTTYTLTGGTDGATTITSSVLVGTDGIGSSRTGMYCLRNQPVSVATICDMTDSTQWTTLASFGMFEGIYMLVSGPAGDNISNAVSTKSSSGLDSYAVKVFFGDWCFWNDAISQTLRLVSPCAFALGRYANLSPEQSGLNKQIFGIAGTQKTGVGAITPSYSEAELQTLFVSGVDVLCSPQPGGDYYGVRLGHNSSSNSAIWGDNYTRLSNYVADTLNAGMGKYEGALINTSLFNDVTATVTSFLMNMLGSGMLGTLDGSLPFSVQCNITNNPFSSTSLGILNCTVQIQYQAINEKFIISVQAGQSVQIVRETQTQD